MEPTPISPTRWLVFEVADEGERSAVWLRRSGTTDVDAWVERKWSRLEKIVAEMTEPRRLVRHRPDLTARWSTRSTIESVNQLRGKIVARLAKEGWDVVSGDPIEVYAIELVEPTNKGRTRLYVGVTSNLEKRLAEHRGEIVDGTPPGRAVVRHGFGRLREDLVEDSPAVPAAAALELEAQVSAALRHRGFHVHGDGVRRRPSHTQFVSGVSWDQLIAAYEDANPNRSPA